MIQQHIIKYQQLQVREITKKKHAIKGKKITKQPTINDQYWKELNMDNGTSSVTVREWEYKKILLLGFVKYKTFNCESLRTIVFKEWYYDMTRRGAYMGLNIYVKG